MWCPLGAMSDPIPFFRSDAALSDDDGALPAATRSPTNYATSFIDLDFVYGRSEEDAEELRVLDGSGRMSLTSDGLPLRTADGESWLVRRVRDGHGSGMRLWVCGRVCCCCCCWRRTHNLRLKNANTLCWSWQNVSLNTLPRASSLFSINCDRCAVCVRLCPFRFVQLPFLAV